MAKEKKKPRIYKRGNKWGYYQRWIDKKGVKRKRWYNVKYAGKFREDLPALVNKGWSGRKALSYLRKTKKYHLRTQTFYDIYREHKRKYQKEPSIAKIPADVQLTEDDGVYTSLDLSTKYLLLFEYDVKYASGRYICKGHYALPLYHLPTTNEAIAMVHARMIMILEQSPKKDKIKRFYSNYKLTGMWIRPEKPIRRLKRGKRYASEYNHRTHTQKRRKKRLSTTSYFL